MNRDLILKELNEAQKVLKNFMSDQCCLQSIEDAAKLIVNTFRSGGKIFSCGNGGSHCDSMHFAEDLIGRYRENRPGYPVISISDPSYLSCVSNDFGYEQVFSRYIEALGNRGDLLIGISTSGNSINIVRAINVARVKGMQVIILSGKKNGKISNGADVEIGVPYFGYSDRIQEIHIKIIHILILIVEKEMSVKR